MGSEHARPTDNAAILVQVARNQGVPRRNDERVARVKYLDPKFSSPANSRAYVEGWERVFGEERKVWRVAISNADCSEVQVSLRDLTDDEAAEMAARGVTMCLHEPAWWEAWLVLWWWFGLNSCGHARTGCTTPRAENCTTWRSAAEQVRSLRG